MNSVCNKAFCLQNALKFALQHYSEQMYLSIKRSCIVLLEAHKHSLEVAVGWCSCSATWAVVLVYLCPVKYPEAIEYIAFEYLSTPSYFCAFFNDQLQGNLS